MQEDLNLFHMEEDMLKDMFAAYRPTLSSDREFMRRLELRMQTIESVNARYNAFRRRQVVAVCVAAVAGFVSGVLFMLFLPALEGWFAALMRGVGPLPFGYEYLDPTLPIWICAAAVSSLAAYGSYGLTLACSKGRCPSH